ncbi:hypothetical protein AB0K20_03175 [Micromonospora matsumotoense]|uniref:hypothetical protein n=1 Tax=Micromonospora matsumotoense TaxID=121616 RepID=UPI0034314130
MEVARPANRARTELGYLILGTVAATAAAFLFTADHTTGIDAAEGTYPLLASLVCVGGCGWLVRSGDARRRRDLTAGLAELTDRLDALAASRTRSTTCRAGMYVSRASQGDTVGIRTIATVDAGTDPAGATIQRAREDGIEQGFEIGYRAQLAERGIPLLPTARRRRLTGDS